MKKKITLIAVLLMMLTLMTACGTSADSTNTNTAASTTAAETDSEVKISENGNLVYTVKQRGIEFEVAQEYVDKGVEVQYYDENEKGYKDLTIYYFSPECMDYVAKLSDATAEESDEYIQKIWDEARCLMEIVIVENDEYEKAMANGGKAEDFTGFAPTEYYGTNDGYTYLISIPDLDESNLSAEAAAGYHACKEYMQTVKESIKFIPLKLEGVFDAVPTFKTTDLMGNEVTQDVFGQADFTVVNIWGTFCGACIDEMPELAQLAEKYDGKVQFLGLVEDVNGFDDTDNLELAQLITEKAGVKYTNLVVNDDFNDFMERVYAFPTTVFVDRSGNVIGDSIVGANVEGVEQRIESILAGNK